jgi:sporulation protein YlmC with PRC-barrel domain
VQGEEDRGQGASGYCAWGFYLGRQKVLQRVIVVAVQRLNVLNLCIFQHHKELRISSQAWWLTSVIPTTWVAEIGKIIILGQVRQKVSKPRMSGSRAWWFVPVIPARWEAEVGGSRSAQANTQDPI